MEENLFVLTANYNSERLQVVVGAISGGCYTFSGDVEDAFRDDGLDRFWGVLVDLSHVATMSKEERDRLGELLHAKRAALLTQAEMEDLDYMIGWITQRHREEWAKEE